MLERESREKALCCLAVQNVIIHPSLLMAFLGGSDRKESACNAGDSGSIPGPGRASGEGNGYPSSILTWRIPWLRSLVGYGQWDCRVGHD